MSKEWVTHVYAKEIEFRILKGGENAPAYEQEWKKANVGFSSDSSRCRQIMTVEYNYGKRIDVSLKEMSRFHVQRDAGRVTIFAEKKLSTFNIRNLNKQHATRIEMFLKLISDFDKPISPNKKPTVSVLHEKQNSLPSSPVISSTKVKNNSKLCHSDGKRKPGSKSLFGGKRLRASQSSEVPCFNRNKKDPKSIVTNESNKKLNDFRKAQACVRTSRISLKFDTNGKENTSPSSLLDKKCGSGIHKDMFYGLTSGSDLVSEIKSGSYIETESLSPARKYRPCAFSAMNTSYHSTGSVIRSLIREVDGRRSEAEVVDDLGVRRLIESQLDSILSAEPFGSRLLSISRSNKSENYSKDDILEKEPPSLDEKPKVPSPVTTSESVESKHPLLSDQLNLPSTGSATGFQNLGNTCYMNSVLQSLFGLVPFQRDLHRLYEKVKSESKRISVLNKPVPRKIKATHVF